MTSSISFRILLIAMLSAALYLDMTLAHARTTRQLPVKAPADCTPPAPAAPPPVKPAAPASGASDAPAPPGVFAAFGSCGASGSAPSTSR